MLRGDSNLGRLPWSSLGTGTMVVSLTHVGITDLDQREIENVCRHLPAGQRMLGEPTLVFRLAPRPCDC